VNDRQAIYVVAFCRALATGMVGVLLGLYLARLGVGAAGIGVVIAAGLVGGALALLVTTWFADRLGRRRTLLLLTALACAGGLFAAVANEVWALVLAAFFGMLNGMGRDRGAALVLEQAILPATADDAGRTQVFARYNVLTDIGHALGGLAAAAPTIAMTFGIGEIAAYRGMFVVYALLLGLALPLYARLSQAAEAGTAAKGQKITPETKRVVWKISGLFAIDSIAGGFLGTALLSYFFFERFAVAAATIGLLFFAARVLNALSHLGAAWLAQRVGLVNTMVFTHIPSSILLASVAFAPNFWVAAVLFLLREGLVEMDVPTRQSYVMAVVKPQERTYASGVTHLVRLGGWAVAPSFAGWLMQAASLAAPLFIGAAMKIGYDLLLWRAFRKIKPPEER